MKFKLIVSVIIHLQVIHFAAFITVKCKRKFLILSPISEILGFC